MMKKFANNKPFCGTTCARWMFARSSPTWQRLRKTPTSNPFTATSSGKLSEGSCSQAITMPKPPSPITWTTTTAKDGTAPSNGWLPWSGGTNIFPLPQLICTKQHWSRRQCQEWTERTRSLLLTLTERTLSLQSR